MILFGALGSAISVIGLAIVATITSPIGLAILAVVGLTAAFVYFWDDIKKIGSWLKNTFVAIFDYIGDKIGKLIGGIVRIKNAVKGLFGSDENSNQSPRLKMTRQNPIEQIFTNSPRNINQNQSISGGGKIDVNFNDLPKGTSTNFTPTPKSFFDVGINSIYSGM